VTHVTQLGLGKQLDDPLSWERGSVIASLPSSSAEAIFIASAIVESAYSDSSSEAFIANKASLSGGKSSFTAFQMGHQRADTHGAGHCRYQRCPSSERSCMAFSIHGGDGGWPRK
jgi:hypothetical protein